MESLEIRRNGESGSFARRFFVMDGYLNASVTRNIMYLVLSELIKCLSILKCSFSYTSRYSQIIE